MDADAVAWFTENGGGTRENGDYFRHPARARRLSRPVGDLPRVRGRDPSWGLCWSGSVFTCEECAWPGVSVGSSAAQVEWRDGGKVRAVVRGQGPPVGSGA